MAKFKAGDKVRIIDVDKIGGADAYFNNGDTTHVLEMTGKEPYLYCNDGDYDTGLYITENEFRYIELISPKPSKNERISLLESQVAELTAQQVVLTAQVEALQKRRKPAVALTQAPTIHNVTVNLDSAKSAVDIGKLIAEGFAKGLGGKPKPTPNQQRKAVIERAKAFVTEVSEKMAKRGHGNVLGKYGEITSNAKGWILRVNFVVNAEKRTVVALLYPFYSDSICTKAIAKCAPDDVFNADIGKAIALGRALGLDVSEFENAVKPTEVVVGHIVKYFRRENGTQSFTHTVKSAKESQTANRDLSGGDAYYYIEISDDTEAQY